jgi:uncharacterized protein YrzB (UPF0473 family)
MPNLPIFPANEAETIPAKVYDKIWVKEIVIKAPDPNGEVQGEVKLTKYGMFDSEEVNESGVPIKKAEMWDESKDIWLRVDNMLTTSTTDADLDTAMQALLGYVYKLGVVNGIIVNPNPTTTTTVAPTTTPAP